MSQSDEELPAVTLSSPEKKSPTKSSKFHMPPADVLAAQRKLEFEQNELLRKRMELYERKYSTDTNCKSSSCKGFDSDDKQSDDHMRSLQHAIHRLDNGNNNDIDDDMINLSTINPNTYDDFNRFSDNPGIKIGALNIHDDDLSGENKKFLRDTFLDLEKNKLDHKLEEYFNEFLWHTEKRLNDSKTISDIEDVYVWAYLLFGIILDNKLGNVFTHTTPTNILWLYIHKIPENLCTTSMVNSLSDKLLSLFQHPYDRLYIAMACVQVKCDPAEIDKNINFIGNRLAKYILYKSVFQILHLDFDETIVKSDTLRSLKKLVNCNKIPSFNIYEQFVLLKTIVAVNDFIAVPRCKRVEEIVVKQWFLEFFRKMLAKYPRYLTRKEDVSNMKTFLSELRLIWSDNI